RSLARARAKGCRCSRPCTLPSPSSPGAPRLPRLPHPRRSDRAQRSLEALRDQRGERGPSRTPQRRPRARRSPRMLFYDGGSAPIPPPLPPHRFAMLRAGPQVGLRPLELPNVSLGDTPTTPFVHALRASRGAPGLLAALAGSRRPPFLGFRIALRGGALLRWS